MNLKIGDKVRMTKIGFKFYSNVNKIFSIHSVALKMEEKHFTSAVCSLFSIHGIGVVKRFNAEGSPYIRWEYSIGGNYYFYEHYFEPMDVKKLSLLDKIIFKLKGRF